MKSKRDTKPKGAAKAASKTAVSTYDVAEHLRTPEEMALYLDACIEESNGDAAFIAKALGDIAKAQGMSKVARDSGLSRESLYKALSGERVPDFSTILKVTKALGVQLHAAPAESSYA
jgi:probable addiction module antidote protein